MTVEEHGAVDFVGLDADGNATLTISDHLPWEQVENHLWHLQEKINTYLRFIEAGEIYEKFPDMRECPIVIDIVLKYAIPDSAHWFFKKSSAAVEKAGFKLRYRIFPG